MVNYLRNADAAGALVAGIERQGGEAIAAQADVSLEADVRRLFQEIDDRFGRLDALVNNAGIVDQSMRVEAMTAVRVSRMLAVNVVGPFLCAREAIARMSITRGGRGGARPVAGLSIARELSPGSTADFRAAVSRDRCKISCRFGGTSLLVP